MLSLSMPRREHRGSDRHARLERAILRVHGGMLLTFALVSTLPMVDAGAWSPTQVVARAVIVLTYVLVTVDLQVRGERLEHIALLLLPLLAGPFLEVNPVPGDVASGLTIGALALSAARQLRPVGYLAMMAPSGLTHIIAREQLSGDLTAGVSDVVVGVGMTWAVYAFVEAIHVAAQRSADADAETREQRFAAEQEEVERRAVAAAGQALHDHVLVALRTIGGGTDGRERMRATCRDAVSAMTDVGASILARDETEEAGSPEELNLRHLVWELERTSPVGFDVLVTGADARVTLPACTYEACLRAVGEALRNVSRHSGSRSAEARFRIVGDTLEVQVVDHGRGMPASSSPGYGTSRSIEAPVAEVGGSVEIRATRGGGVTVELTLPLPEVVRRSVLARNYDLVEHAMGSTRPILLITWPVALVWLYMALRFSAKWPNPAVSLFLALLYVVATALVLRRVANRAPSGQWVVAAGVGLLALNALSLWLAPDGSLLDYRSWTMGFLAAPLVALVMVLPPFAALAVHLPHVVLILVAVRLDPALTDGAQPLGSLNAVLATPVAAFVLGRLLRRIGRRIDREEREAARLSAARAAKSSMAVVEHLHLERTRRTVVPWLAALAKGESDPMDADAAERARLLAAEVRDDLYAPGFLDGPLRTLVGDFRRRGGTFTIRPVDRLGTSVDGVRVVIARILRGVEHHSKITVDFDPHGRGEVVGTRLAVVPPLSADALQSLEDCEVETDEYRTVAIVAPGVGRSLPAPDGDILLGPPLREPERSPVMARTSSPTPRRDR